MDTFNFFYLTDITLVLTITISTNPLVISKNRHELLTRDTPDPYKVSETLPEQI